MPFRFLTSFHFHAKTDLQELVDLRNGPCQIFADSGAYSAITVGATINFQEYAAWLRQWDQLLTVKATLDVIGDHAATMRNTRRLEDLGLQVLPVFHVGTPLVELEKLCAEYDYLALGGMVPHKGSGPALLRWLVRCFQVAQHTGTVYHGFGQTSQRILSSLPFFSVDSSACAKGARFGEMMLWDDRKRGFTMVPVGNPAMAKQHSALLRSHGASPSEVGTSGFSKSAEREPARYKREREVLLGAPSVGYTRFGEHLGRRHRVPTPSSYMSTGMQGNGTQVYLAEMLAENLRMMINHFNAMEAP